MANIKNLEMADALSRLDYITFKKSLFGTRGCYAPTDSRLDIHVQEYMPAEGARIERLLSLPADQLAAELTTKGHIASTPVGHDRLEIVASRDGRFLAAQLFRFVPFKFTAVTELRVYRDDEATLAQALID